jgi:repressor LexA
VNQRLSQRQEEIVAFIQSEIEQRGYPPSIREIGKAVHLLSTAAVLANLRSLEKKGVIRRDGSKRRAIDLVRRNGNNGVALPIPVRNGFGDMEKPTEGNEEYVRIHGQAVFRLPDDMPPCSEARGGDFIVVSRNGAYLPGDLLFVSGGGRPFCARCSEARNDLVTIVPQEAAAGPITLETIAIVGKISTVIRKFD